MELCGELALSGMTSDEQAVLFRRIRRYLGEPVVGVAIADSQIETAIIMAIEEYSSYINNWALENRMSQMLGLPKDIDFTLKFVSNNFGFEKTFTQAYSEQAGTAMNSNREMKVDSISLTANTQDYYIPAGREVSEIMWYTPNFVNFFGLDPFSSANMAFSEFGASYAGYNLYHVMPLFDTILTAQAAKLRNKVRGSEYSYRMVGGPNGTKRLSLYPIPRTTGTPETGTGGIGTPGTMFYLYYDSLGIGGNEAFSGNTANPGYTGGTGTQGNGLVSGPSDAKLYYLTYNELNDVGKTWVKKYAMAHSAKILGRSIYGKFSGELPIPGATVTLNADMLLADANKEIDTLKEELKDTLEKLNYKAILENNAAIQENINKTMGYNPLGIFIG